MSRAAFFRSLIFFLCLCLALALGWSPAVGQDRPWVAAFGGQGRWQDRRYDPDLRHRDLRGPRYNYLDNMVDKEGLPYFDIFWTEPAEAAHDWPDFGDVMSRQLQTAIMARHLTGRPARHEKLWAQKILSYLDPKTGLLVQPEDPFWHSDDPQDARRPCRWTCSPSLSTPWRRATPTAERSGPSAGHRKMMDHLRAERTMNWASHQGPDGLRGRWTARSTRRRWPRRETWSSSSSTRMILFSRPTTSSAQGGHMHGSLRTLWGPADYALYVKDPVLFSRVDALYRYVRSTAPGSVSCPRSCDGRAT